MNWTEITATLIITLLGGGGIISNWLNQRRAKKLTSNDSIVSRISILEEYQKKDYKHLDSIERRLDKLSKSLERNNEGTLLSLQNDQVIFDYFRTNKINGNSENQIKAMRAYYKKCAEEVLDV